jgi:FkbM family methyltransferase
MRLPILAGALRGRWWLLESRGQLGRVLTGRYEPEHSRVFAERVAPGDVVVDVGAHAGYYTLLAASLAGPGGGVWAFEPDPRNCSCLRRQVSMNRLANVVVEEAAVADRVGRQPFRFGSGSGTGFLGVNGDIDVRTVTLDSVLAGRVRPTLVKIDAEGAEARVLDGAREILDTARPAIILSTHGAEVHRDCIQFLERLAYRLSPIVGRRVDETTELLCLPS